MELFVLLAALGAGIALLVLYGRLRDERSRTAAQLAEIVARPAPPRPTPAPRADRAKFEAIRRVAVETRTVCQMRTVTYRRLVELLERWMTEMNLARPTIDSKNPAELQVFNRYVDAVNVYGQAQRFWRLYIDSPGPNLTLAAGGAYEKAAASYGIASTPTEDPGTVRIPADSFAVILKAAAVKVDLALRP